MKKILVLALLASALSVQPAMAQNGPFTINASCSFNPAVGQCSVFNQWASPIYCQIRIRGIVSSGAWFTAYENVTVYPGQDAYGYVYAKNPNFDPLVDTGGVANCRF